MLCRSLLFAFLSCLLLAHTSGRAQLLRPVARHQNVEIRVADDAAIRFKNTPKSASSIFTFSPE